MHYIEFPIGDILNLKKEKENKKFLTKMRRFY